MPITTSGPLVWVPPRQNRKPKLDSAVSAILHSSPDPSSLALAALPADAVPAFNVRAIRPATVHPDRLGAGFRTSDKKCSASLHLV
jgi:hypothetical protein